MNDEKNSELVENITNSPNEAAESVGETNTKTNTKDNAEITEDIETDTDPITGDGAEIAKVEPISEKHIDLENIEKKFKNIELTFVKKINELEVENKKLEKQIKFYYSSHEKLLALVDQQNYLNRLIKRVTDEKKYASRNLALKILKPIDWLEQTLAGATTDSSTTKEVENSWLQGLAHINERFITALAEENIKVIELKPGDEFNHETCNAVEQTETNEFPPNTIVKVCEKGYFLYDRVLRHATVIVAKKPEDASEEIPETDSLKQI